MIKYEDGITTHVIYDDNGDGYVIGLQSAILEVDDNGRWRLHGQIRSVEPTD